MALSAKFKSIFKGVPPKGFLYVIHDVNLDRFTLQNLLLQFVCTEAIISLHLRWLDYYGPEYNMVMDVTIFYSTSYSEFYEVNA
jgi:hypothetical protein